MIWTTPASGAATELQHAAASFPIMVGNVALTVYNGKVMDVDAKGGPKLRVDSTATGDGAADSGDSGTVVDPSDTDDDFERTPVNTGTDIYTTLVVGEINSSFRIENLLEDTVARVALPGRSIPFVSPRGDSLLLSICADVCSVGDVLISESRGPSLSQAGLTTHSSSLPWQR